MAVSLPRSAVRRVWPLRPAVGALGALVALAAAAGCIDSFSLRDAAVDLPSRDVAPGPCPSDGGGCPAGATCAVGCACAAGLVRGGGACWPAPRPLGPPSSATVTSWRPTLRWALPPGAGAHVELCRDRALTRGCAAFDATGGSARPATDLAPGVWFWRLATRVDGATTAAVGPVWQFTVGRRSAPRDLAWGSTLDVNGDGLADVAVGTDLSSTVYLYLGRPDVASLGDAPIALSAHIGSGNHVASAGDVNGDGFTDLLVGAGSSNAAYVYLGGPGEAPWSAPPVTLTTPTGGSAFGNRVAGAGDVDMDGYADVLVGAELSNAAYVYRGGPGANALSAPPITLIGPAGSRFFGNSVAGAGDVNGDGYPDIAVGAFRSSTTYVYLGGPGATPPRAPQITLTGPVESGHGGVVACAGDVDGDGDADLAVGAYRADRAYVYLGDPDEPLQSERRITFARPPSDGYGGYAVGGDVDGNGFSDVIVTGASLNQADVFFGGPGEALRGARPVTLRGPPGSAYFGTEVGTGDLNGDGHDDFVIGAFLSSTAYVFLGGAGLGALGAPPPTVLTGPEGSRFGFSVAYAGGPDHERHARVTGSAPRRARHRAVRTTGS